MKVLEITGEPIHHGGQERFIFNLVENNDDEKLRIDVLTPYDIDNDKFCESIRIHGGQVIGLGLEFTPGKSRKNIYRAIKDYLSFHNYDVAHIHSGSISVLAYAARAAREAGVAKVIVHSHATASQSLKHTVVRAVFGKIIEKYATDFLACSQAAGEDKYPRAVVRKSMRVVPNGINTRVFIRNDMKRKTLRKTLGVCDDNYVVGHVGRFSPEKNHAFLITLFEEYCKSNEKTRLLLVGDGELKEDIQEIVKAKKVERGVIFVGNIDNIEDYYQAMDCFVFPSRFEGFGYVALEAQAAGLPCVISTEVPKDVMVGDNIRQLPLDDISAWIKAIDEFSNMPVTDNTKAIQDLGYDIEKTVRIVQQLYLV